MYGEWLGSAVGRYLQLMCLSMCFRLSEGGLGAHGDSLHGIDHGLELSADHALELSARFSLAALCVRVCLCRCLCDCLCVYETCEHGGADAEEAVRDMGWRAWRTCAWSTCAATAQMQGNA